MTQTDKKNDLHKIHKRRRKPWNLAARSLVSLTQPLSFHHYLPLREFLPNRDSLRLCPIPNGQSGSVTWRIEEGRGTSWHDQ